MGRPTGILLVTSPPSTAARVVFVLKSSHHHCTLCCLYSTIALYPKTGIQKPLTNGKNIICKVIFLMFYLDRYKLKNCLAFYLAIIFGTLFPQKSCSPSNLKSRDKYMLNGASIKTYILRYLYLLKVTSYSPSPSHPSFGVQPACQILDVFEFPQLGLLIVSKRVLSSLKQDPSTGYFLLGNESNAVHRLLLFPLFFISSHLRLFGFHQCQLFLANDLEHIEMLDCLFSDGAISFSTRVVRRFLF